MFSQELELAWLGSGLSECFPHLVLREETSSTMELARKALHTRIAELGEFEGRCSLAAFAKTQTQGRGRGASTWHSPPGAGLYVTFGWAFSQQLPSLAALSLAAGVALHRYCTTLGLQTKLKWPNDLLLAAPTSEQSYKNLPYRKLAGILTECSSHGTNRQEAYVGIGLNIRSQAYPAGIPAVSLEEALSTVPSHTEVAIGLAKEIHSVINDFWESGFGIFCNEYNEASMISGHHVRSSSAEENLLAIRVLVDGGLLCQSQPSGHTRVLYSAEIVS